MLSIMCADLYHYAIGGFLISASNLISGQGIAKPTLHMVQISRLGSRNIVSHGRPWVGLRAPIRKMAAQVDAAGGETGLPRLRGFPVG